RTRLVVEQIFTSCPSASLAPREPHGITLHLRGTNFQIKVWEALIRLPPGAVTSYEALAEQVCSVKAARAVGNALARNPVAYLIPCHRVLQKAGGFGNYRYGPARKQAILGWEMAQVEG
ncbi:MAG: MGMT family protein, partial [Chloroflexi bacterium]|nr:MGMT family protein [Chloroflexota bacterium]